MRVLLACLACLVLSVANAAKAQDVTTLLSPAKPKAPEAITLADIPGRADADERYAEEVSLRAARADPLGRLVPRLATIEKSVAEKNGLFAYGELRTLPVLRLESMERHWKFDARQYARWRGDMQASVAPYAQGAAELALRSLYPRASGTTLDLRQDLVMSAVFSDLLAVREVIAAQTATEARLRQSIEQRMGDATRALFENGEVSWKRSKDGVTLDTARLQKDQAPLLQGYTVPKPGSRRFLVQT